MELSSTNRIGLDDRGVERRNWKRIIVHELEEVAEIFVILLIFSMMLTTYRMMVLNAFHSKLFLYTTAFVNAAIAAKVIVIGEHARMGKRAEDKPLIYLVLYKAFLFSVLLTAFEVLEDAVKQRIHGHRSFAELTGSHARELITRSVVFFLVFVLFFAFREALRVSGNRRAFDLFFRRRYGSNAGEPAHNPDAHTPHVTQR